MEGVYQERIDPEMNPEQTETLDRFHAAGVKLDVAMLDALENAGLDAKVIANKLEAIAVDPEEKETLVHLRANIASLLNPNLHENKKKELARLIQAEVS
jgi:hypothetical protein